MGLPEDFWAAEAQTREKRRAKNLQESRNQHEVICKWHTCFLMEDDVAVTLEDIFQRTKIL